MQSETTRSIADDAVPAALAGVGAYVVGYVLTYLVAAGRASEQWGEAFPAWKAVGWYFYNGHFVDVFTTRSVGPFGAAGTRNLIAAADGAALGILYAIPPLVLVAAGIAVGRLSGRTDAARSATAGAAVTTSYFLLSVVGAVLFEHTASGEFLGVDVGATIGPQFAPAAILAGIVYPVVFGAIGGALAGVLDGRTVDRTTSAG